MSRADRQAQPVINESRLLWVKIVLSILIICTFILVIIPTALYSLDVLRGINDPYNHDKELMEEYPELGVSWEMHPVDNPGDWLPNGLDPYDVNGDGWDDYLTNYEYNGRIRVAFHPGFQPGQAYWYTTDVGYFPNAESSAFGDLDNDGIADIIVAHGVEHTQEPAGIRVLWGISHNTDQANKPAGLAPWNFDWIDGGDIPASQQGWHFLDITTIDLDQDGDLDILAGGRAARLASSINLKIQDKPLQWAGIRWFRNPGTGSTRVRNLAAWVRFDLDPDTYSGHGIEFGDLDGDGDLDIANGNADWDTPNTEENLVWYENPGPGANLFLPWSLHEVYRSNEFYGKEQVVIADIDGDGNNDLITQTETLIHLFYNHGYEANAKEITFEHLPIQKHPAAQWRARPMKAADLNNDGRIDLIGALIHRSGSLPRDKAAIFWMEQSPHGWISHVIKWGDGFQGLGAFNGEKWDQLVLTDTDGDGDLDLIANCEEYNRLRSILSVVWFENPSQ